MSIAKRHFEFDNMITGLLINLIKKNHTYTDEGFIFLENYVEIKIDISGIDIDLITESMEEIFNLKTSCVDEKRGLTYSSKISILYLADSDSYIMVQIPTFLFIIFRKDVLKSK